MDRKNHEQRSVGGLQLSLVAAEMDEQGKPALSVGHFKLAWLMLGWLEMHPNTLGAPA